MSKISYTPDYNQCTKLSVITHNVIKAGYEQFIRGQREVLRFLISDTKGMSTEAYNMITFMINRCTDALPYYTPRNFMEARAHEANK